MARSTAENCVTALQILAVRESGLGDMPGAGELAGFTDRQIALFVISQLVIRYLPEQDT